VYPSIWSRPGDLRVEAMDNRYIAAAEFKANCLRLIDEVAGSAGR
jgi:hypothetical protein